MYPRGATDDQLIWRLAVSGLRISASELLASLSDLADRGEIVRDESGRWLVLPRPQPSADHPTLQSGLEIREDALLHAAIATWESLRPAPEDAEAPAPAPVTSLPPWPLLARYYAATQRKDPRGQIIEFAERHGRCWQLLQMSGAWWEDALLRVPMEALPEPLRESVSRRGGIAAAIGWPIVVVNAASGLEILPALLLPVEILVEADTLLVAVEQAAATPNRSWLKRASRQSGWAEDELLAHLTAEGAAADLGAVSDRMRHTLARLGGAGLKPGTLQGSLQLTVEGLQNVASLFLPEDSTFTRGVARDLDQLAGWDEQTRSGTALASLYAATSPARRPEIVALDGHADRLLTETQRDAAQTALDGPLTVVQGPPGTGKSEVILSIVLSAVVAGRTVLMAARNHQAIDELEERLSELVPGSPILTRARDADGERDTSFGDALLDISHCQPRGADGSTEAALAEFLDAAEAAALRRRKVAKQLALACRFSELVEVETVCPFPDPAADVPASWFAQLVQRLARLLGRRGGEALSQVSLAGEIQQLQEELAQIARTDPGLDCTSVSRDAEKLARELARVLPLQAHRATTPDAEALEDIVRRARDFTFMGAAVARMSEDDARTVLAHRPGWAVSTLSVPARIPLVPALFDYVIFDEASQCDIASALPLMARARRAVIVGDPLQLSFVPGLSRLAEHALMDSVGLPSTDRSRIAQSTNSLFDFCSTLPGARRVFLKDQFRSAPGIVGYLNEAFYGNRLVVRRDEESLNTPAAYRSGLTWLDVNGHAGEDADGPRNRAEADAIIERLRTLAGDPQFTGSVGVISPFNAQVALLQRLIAEALSQQVRDRLRLKIATVDKFQGGEADVILFSLVVTPTARQSAKTFLQRERRRLNVAVSRARALCIVVGDLAYARGCGIHHIAHLADRATRPPQRYRPDMFDSVWERRLDVAMRERGLSPFPQYNVGWRYLDFALDPEGRKLDVEVDGRRWHTDSAGNRKVADMLRDRELQARGWTIQRFWVHELSSDMEGCLDRIEHALAGR